MSALTKTRQQKADKYEEKYSHIPRDYNERLAWMYDHYKITPAKEEEILRARTTMINSLYYTDFNIVLYEEPEGAPRPRFRLVNKGNLASMAMANADFIHVYSPTGAQDNRFMRRLVTESDFEALHNNLICTPCTIDYYCYIKTPTVFNKVDVFLSEIGLIRPIKKPDWDNLGKKYCDMYNGNVWIDDILTIDGAVHKYYSVLPRVEINLRFMNQVYNKYQYDMITRRNDYKEEYGLQYVQY